MAAVSNLEELKRVVQRKFTEIRGALYMREKLLLRQVDVIATTQQQMGCGMTHSLTGQSNSTTADEETREVKFLVEQEDELLAAIRSFGRFQLGNMNLTLQDVYLKNEDYIAPSNDHETMYKCLQTADERPIEIVDGFEEQPETIVVDFSKNKSLIEHNAKHMNESIINITLQEAKELIRKARVKREMPIPPLNLEELDDELESSIAEAVSSLGREPLTAANTKSSQTCTEAAMLVKKAKKSRFKPKITINNCNGTINLRNISSLTINCATEDSVNAQLQGPIPKNRSAADEGEGGDLPYTKLLHKTKTPLPADTISTTGNSTPTTTASSSNYSSNSSSRSQSKKQKSGKKSKNTLPTSSTTTTGENSAMMGAGAPKSSHPYVGVDNEEEDDEVANVVTCDFYNRLLNEIKNSIKQQHHKSRRSTTNEEDMAKDNVKVSAMADSTCEPYSNGGPTAVTSTTSEFTSTSTIGKQQQQQQQQQPPPPNANAGKRLILKNFENLRIVLEANSDEDSFRPVQIEQWLAEIISETDLEPMQNTDILEHSRINNEST